MRPIFLAFFLSNFALSPLHGEAITGKVKAISVDKRQITVVETGIGSKDNALLFGIEAKAIIVEQIRGKRLKLPNGLADIRPGDYVTLARTGTEVHHIVRFKADPRKR